MHGDGLAHAGWRLWMCPDPDAGPASHTVHLACNDHLVGYLPVVGPGKSLAVAMVADSDSSRGRRGEQHRDKKGDHKVQRKHVKLAWSVFIIYFLSLFAEVTGSEARCQSRVHALLELPETAAGRGAQDTRGQDEERRRSVLCVCVCV